MWRKNIYMMLLLWVVYLLCNSTRQIARFMFDDTCPLSRTMGTLHKNHSNWFKRLRKRLLLLYSMLELYEYKVLRVNIHLCTSFPLITLLTRTLQIAQIVIRFKFRVKNLLCNRPLGRDFKHGGFSLIPLASKLPLSRLTRGTRPARPCYDL